MGVGVECGGIGNAGDGRASGRKVFYCWMGVVAAARREARGRWGVGGGGEIVGNDGVEEVGRNGRVCDGGCGSVVGVFDVGVRVGE